MSRNTFLWMLLAGLCAFAPPLGAQTAGESDDEPLRVLRVRVPADHALKLVQEEKVPYDTIEAARFDELLRLAGQTAGELPAAGRTRLVEAEYEARFDGERLTAGQARLQMAHGAPHAVLLPLEPCSLAFTTPAWESQGGPAVVGLHSTGRLCVLVERSDTLLLPWSLGGRRHGADAVVFDLHFPSCVSKRLLLDLPADYVPIISHGIASHEDAPAGERQRWTIELGGRNQLSLRIAPQAAASQQRLLTLLRQTSTYDISPRGLELAAQLTLDVHHEPLRELSVVMDSALRVVSARYGENDLKWTVAADPQSGQNRLTIQLPEPLAGTGRVVRLEAVCPLVSGVAWKLPGLQPEGVFWAEESTRLLVRSPLALSDVSAVGCRQTRAEPLPAPEDGELVELQHFAPAATIEATLVELDGELSARQATMVEVDGTKLTARSAVDWTIVGADRFTLTAQVASDWIIDAVESVPLGSVADWSIESAKGGSQTLTVRLAKALTPRGHLHLVVSGRSRKAVLEERVTVGDCRMLTLDDARVERSLMLLRTLRPYELEISGEEQLARLDPAQLDSIDQELLDDEWTGILFVLDEEAEGKTLALRDERPRYAGHAQVEATVQPDSLLESYVFRCTPESARVERLLVHFSQASPQPLGWSMGEGSQPQLTARKLTPRQQAAAGLGAGGETWEVVLRQPRSVPFEFQAARSLPFEAATSVGLAALPAATDHSGTLTIRVANQARFSIQNDRLEPIPADGANSDRYPLVRGVFRFQPLRDVLAGGEPALVLAPASHGPEAASLLVWSCRLQSRYTTTGLHAHLVTYHLQNISRRRFALKMPDGAKVQTVWVDDVEMQQPTGKQEFVVELPAGRKFPVVSISFELDQAPLGILRKVRPPLPQIDELPVMAESWTVWLPPGYQAVGGELRPAPPESSWSRRLFGPFARSISAAPFQPLSLREWTSLLAVSSAERHAEQAAQALLERWNQAIDGRPNAGISWGALLAAAETADPTAEEASSTRSPALLLLVDLRALSQAGITPSKPVPLGQNGNGGRAALAALEQAGLALLVHPGRLLLTSTSNAARYRAQLAPMPGGPLHRILEGPLDEMLSGGAPLPEYWPLPTAAQWAALSGDVEIPWVRHWQTAHDPGGWSAVETLVQPDRSAAVYVVHQHAVASLSWALLLLMASLVCWKLASRPLALAAAVTLSAALALLLPEALAPLASGAFMGAAAALIVLVAQYRRCQIAEEPSTVREEETIVTAAAPWLLALVLAVWGAQAARAQAPTAEGDSPVAASDSAPNAEVPPRVYKVFIPVDQDDQPAGNTLYVPEALRLALEQRAAAVTQEPRGWLLTGAEYRAALLSDAATNHLAVERLDAQFDLRSYSQVASVRLPLRRDQVALLPEGALLDGRPVEVAWDAGGQGLVVQLRDAGEHRLSLSLQPVLQEAAGSSGFNLAVPRLPSSRVEVSLPAGPVEVQLPSATGAIAFDGEQGKLEAGLGAADRLAVRWPLMESRGMAPPSIESEELTWLKVQPGSVVIDLRLKLKVSDGALRQLRLAADSRLRLLPLGDQSPVGEVRTEPGQPQVLTLELKRPITDRAVVDLRLLWTGISGVGNLPLPHLQLLSTRMSRRVLAVSVDDALQYEESPDEGLHALEIADFAAAWGDPRVRPALAYQVLLGDQGSWALATRPRQPRVSAQEWIALSVGRQSADMHYEANVSVGGGYLFQHRIAVPETCIIDEVLVTQAGAARSVRWSRSASNRLTVFLTNNYVDGDHRVVLRGRLPIPAGGRLPLPRIELQTADQAAVEYQVFRQHDTLVELEPDNGFQLAEDETDQPDRPEWGRLVARAAASPPGNVRLIVRANDPTIAPTSAIATRVVQRSDNTWQAEVDYRIDLEQGLLDVVRLNVPSWWEGPFEVEPAAEVRLVEMPGGNRKQLLIRPSLALRGQARLQVRADLPLRDGDRLRVPAVVPAGAEKLEKYLLLPTQSGLQPLAWETTQLQPAPLPEPFFVDSEVRGGFETFQIVSDAFEAAPKSSGRATRMPQVRLADMRMAWNLDGACHGVATFDLEPAGLDHCVLRLPPGYALLYASVAGLPAMLDPLGDGRWQVALGPRQLPQRIEAVFAGRHEQESSEGRIRLRAPMLYTGEHAMHVERTLWTVLAPQAAGPGQPERGQLIDPLRQNLLRLTSTASLLDVDSEVAQQPTEHLARWYRSWARRLLVAQQSIRREAATPPTAAGADEALAEAQSIVAEHESVARRLGTHTVLAQLAGGPLHLSEACELWPRSVSSDYSAARSMYQGAVPSLVVKYPLPLKSGSYGRPLAALACGLLFVALALSANRVAWSDAFWRWPHLFGCLAGLAWWLWLWPSALGWLIVAASLAAMVRTPWQLASGPSQESTVVRFRDAP